MQDLRGSKATAAIISATLALLSLAFLFLAIKAAILIDMDAYLSGEPPAEWYEWREDVPSMDGEPNAAP